MIDGETWEILAWRLEQIRRLRREQEEREQEEKVTFIYDSHDQARIAC